MATLHRTLASLNDSQLMNVLREKKRQTLGKTKKSVKNVLITIEHFLVAWESEDCCLLFKNLLEPLDSTSAWAQRKNNEKSPTDRFLVNCLLTLELIYACLCYWEFLFFAVLAIFIHFRNVTSTQEITNALATIHILKNCRPSNYPFNIEKLALPLEISFLFLLSNGTSNIITAVLGYIQIYLCPF